MQKKKFRDYKLKYKLNDKHDARKFIRQKKYNRKMYFNQ